MLSLLFSGLSFRRLGQRRSFLRGPNCGKSGLVPRHGDFDGLGAGRLWPLARVPPGRFGFAGRCLHCSRRSRGFRGFRQRVFRGFRQRALWSIDVDPLSLEPSCTSDSSASFATHFRITSWTALPVPGPNQSEPPCRRAGAPQPVPSDWTQPDGTCACAARWRAPGHERYPSRTFFGSTMNRAATRFNSTTNFSASQ